MAIWLDQFIEADIFGQILFNTYSYIQTVYRLMDWKNTNSKQSLLYLRDSWFRFYYYYFYRQTDKCLIHFMNKLFADNFLSDEKYRTLYSTPLFTQWMQIWSHFTRKLSKLISQKQSKFDLHIHGFG